MSLLEQTLSIYYAGKTVAERVQLEGTEWLKGVSWIDAVTGIDLTDDIIERAAWYLKVQKFLDQYDK